MHQRGWILGAMKREKRHEDPGLEPPSFPEGHSCIIYASGWPIPNEGTATVRSTLIPGRFTADRDHDVYVRVTIPLDLRLLEFDQCCSNCRRPVND